MANLGKQFAEEGGADAPASAGAGDEDMPALVEADGAEADDGDVDTSGIEANDIQLVMGQTGASKAKAVAAIREADGDIVNAIMVGFTF